MNEEFEYEVVTESNCWGDEFAGKKLKQPTIKVKKEDLEEEE